MSSEPVKEPELYCFTCGSETLDTTAGSTGGLLHSQGCPAIAYLSAPPDSVPHPPSVTPLLSRYQTLFNVYEFKKNNGNWEARCGICGFAAINGSALEHETVNDIEKHYREAHLSKNSTAHCPGVFYDQTDSKCRLAYGHLGPCFDSNRRCNGCDVMAVANERWCDTCRPTVKAVKFDDGKPRFDLLPPGALIQIGEVLRYGAAKYADRNWEAGLARKRLVRAAMGHLLAYMTGEDKDPESGLPHLAHLGCCVLFLIEYTIVGIGEDDRTKMYERKSNEGTASSVGWRNSSAEQQSGSSDNERQATGCG